MKERKEQDAISIKSDLSCASKMLDSSNSNNSGHYKESNSHNQNVVDKLREESRKEMGLICKECGLKQELLRLLLELEYNPIIYNKIRVNGMLYECDYHIDWDYFVKKQKMRGEICIILIYLKSMQTIL